MHQEYKEIKKEDSGINSVSKMKKIFFLFLFLLVLSPLVIAQPPFEQRPTLTEGYFIEIPEQGVLKANDNFTFFFHIFNISNGLPLSGVETSCEFNLHNSSSNLVFTDISLDFDSTTFAFSIELDGANFTEVGDYTYVTHCNSTSFGGVVSVDVRVTSSGFSINEGNSNILYTTILFLMVLGTIFLLGFIKTKDKFQIKWTFFIIGYILFLSALTLIQISLRDSLINPVIINFIDTFLAMGFLLFWFSFGLLIITWFITLLQALLFRKKQKEIAKFE